MAKGKSNGKRVPVSSLQHKDKWADIPAEWKGWCKTGRHKGPCKRNAIVRCLKNGVVRGYFSGFPLDPKCLSTDSMYPSVEHLAGRKNPDVVVETRIVNDMKSHLSEKEFWQLIGHLFLVGSAGGKVVPPAGKRLPGKWRPQRQFQRVKPTKE